MSKFLSANRYGAFWINLKGGKPYNTTSFIDDKSPNSMNDDVIGLLNAKERVGYPYVRKSYLLARGAAKNELRGKEEFVRVEWDEALALAANALKESFDRYGAQSIYGECYFWGGSGKVSWGRSVAHRMLDILGGSVRELGDYSTGAGQVILPYIIGSEGVYEEATKWEAVLKGAEYVLFWGCDALVTSQTHHGVPLHENYPYFDELKSKNLQQKIKIDSIDVWQNQTASYLGINCLKVQACSDTALALGLCHYLLVNGNYDKEFIDKFTVGFDEFRRYILGEIDGVVKDISWASQICGLDIDTLKTLATNLRQKRSLIIIGRSLQRSENGEQCYHAIITLSAMLGHIGKCGCGFDFGLGYGCAGANSYVAPKLLGLDEVDYKKHGLKNPEHIFIPSSRFSDALLNPGVCVSYDGKELNLPRIRVAYNASGAMFTRHQDTNRLLKAWRNLDTVITAEPFWTATARLSDIVLPVALESERVDILASSGGHIFALKGQIKPYKQSRSDYEICRGICEIWGKESAFSEGKSELEWVRQIYQDARDKAINLGYKNVPVFEEFWEQGYFKFDKINEQKRYYTRLFDFVNGSKLATKSGKIEIYSKDLAELGYADFSGYAVWHEPIEWSLRDKFKLSLVSPHSKYRLHSQLDNSSTSQLAKIAGLEPIVIHPDDAKPRGLEDGGIARVYNNRGEILCGVMISDKVAKGVVIVKEGAWYEPQIWGEASLCLSGNVNVLTRDMGCSSLSQSNCAHTALVEVEPFKGEMPIKSPVLLED